ncbi:MAG: hypothetical protein U1A78_34560 [Polyangia bacterium]
MRNSELRQLLVSAVPRLTLQVAAQQTGHILVTGLTQFRTGIQLLSALRQERMQNLVKAAANLGLYRYPEDSVLLAQDVANNLAGLASQAQNYAREMIVALDLINPSATPGNSISFKFPPVATLEDFSATARSLQQIFDQPLQRLAAEQTGVEGFDVGSFWVDLSFHTPVALGVAMGILKVYKKFYMDRLQIAYATEILREKRIKNNYLDAVQQSSAEQLQLLVEAHAEQVVREAERDRKGELDEGERHEALNALKHSVRELDRLIERGAEVHPSLNAPSVVKEALPEPLSLESLKQLMLPAHEAPLKDGAQPKDAAQPKGQKKTT